MGKAEKHVNTVEDEAKKKEAAAHDAVLAEIAKEKKVKAEAMKMRKEAEEEAMKMKEKAEKEAMNTTKEGEEKAEKHVNTVEDEAKQKEAAAHNAVLAEVARLKKLAKQTLMKQEEQ